MPRRIISQYCVEITDSPVGVVRAWRRVSRLGAVGGRRGVVVAFSKASRRRMLRFISSVSVYPQVFMTLTFPDDVLPLGFQEAKRHLLTFWKRLKRRFPSLAMLWRMEVVPRKSGRYVGVWVPHFHILVWGLPFTSVRELLGQWLAVIGVRGDVRSYSPALELKLIHSPRHAYAYVSKYVAKVATPPPAGDEDGGVDLDVGAYLSTGRWWGVLGRDCIPRAHVYRFSVSRSVFYTLRRYLRRRAGRAWAVYLGIALVAVAFRYLAYCALAPTS